MDYLGDLGRAASVPVHSSSALDVFREYMFD